MLIATSQLSESNLRGRQALSLVDVCAGGGGLALGLHTAGFQPVLLLDDLEVASNTLRINQPDWNVFHGNLLKFDPADHSYTYDASLLSAGLPRVKASATTARSRGSDVELELLKATVMLVHGIQPKCLLIENLADLVVKETYRSIRTFIEEELIHLGYRWKWFVLDAADFGVPQERKQGFLIAFKDNVIDQFQIPQPAPETERMTVGRALYESMASRGWQDAATWAAYADRVAPTLVGGSMDRGGADLGPSGTKRAWARMGVFGGSLADETPPEHFRWRPELGREGMVRLTVPQTAILQGFPKTWRFAGRKTIQYRQIGQATPPPVGKALGSAIRSALTNQ
ncbi:DNA cytosine methyltransferase [Nocardia mexicana]|uniref:DNA (cytosine-5-)-methyltransferase n=1 Tax=Nocardia mexicana TaxID=279262 RepID=A0A370H556_9NOCA|nr:DNA cytosine methyltransferase [Nocardia mexicana]RDI49166.1 DNA (cytosine-5)-methyltransferase 1 [Nocardia mexicana]